MDGKVIVSILGPKIGSADCSTAVRFTGSRYPWSVGSDSDPLVSIRLREDGLLQSAIGPRSLRSARDQRGQA